MLSYSINKYSQQEIKDILSLFDPYSFIPNNHLVDEKLYEWLTKLSSNAYVLTCYIDQEIAATMFFYANDIAVKRNEGYCSYFCVLPKYRRYGVATYSINIVKSYLKDKGIANFKLQCAKQNKAAYKLYLKNGFSVVAEDNNNFTLVSQISEDA